MAGGGGGRPKLSVCRVKNALRLDASANSSGENAQHEDKCSNNSAAKSVHASRLPLQTLDTFT